MSLIVVGLCLVFFFFSSVSPVVFSLLVVFFIMKSLFSEKEIDLY